MSKLKGSPIQARWYNPRSGQYLAAGQFANEGVKKIYSPLQDDWVLLLRSE